MYMLNIFNNKNDNMYLIIKVLLNINVENVFNNKSIIKFKY